MRRKKVLCAGGGLAALNFALHVDDDTEVLVLTADSHERSNSFLARGGIAVPAANDVDRHIEDTLKAGDGVCDPDAVADIIPAGHLVLRELWMQGFHFDPGLCREGGHSAPRIHHVGDETGQHLTSHIAKLAAKKRNVRIVPGALLLDLRVEHLTCTGALIGNQRSCKLEWHEADAVVLATGGCGSLYRYHTNSDHANGEGYAVAHRAGAALWGMEFEQFHPTMLDPAAGWGNFLVTEAFRGSGAVLTGLHGEDLMMDVHPMKSLAPRDVVSRTIAAYMQEHCATHVWLDFSRVDALQMEKGFPALREVCKHNGYFQHARIPVVPAAHYMCGGVRTDRHGETTVNGLYAVGEVACTGLHGANRLASNSLLELMVMSRRVAKRINQLRICRSHKVKEMNAVRGDSALADRQHAEIRNIMWNNAGILRREAVLEEGIRKIGSMHSSLSAREERCIEAIQMRNRLETALLIMQSALAAKESRGCHFRIDSTGRENEEEVPDVRDEACEMIPN